MRAREESYVREGHEAPSTPRGGGRSRARVGVTVIARRLTGDDLRLFERYRDDIGAELHARLIFKDSMRWITARKR